MGGQTGSALLLLLSHRPAADCSLLSVKSNYSRLIIALIELSIMRMDRTKGKLIIRFC